MLALVIAVGTLCPMTTIESTSTPELQIEKLTPRLKVGTLVFDRGARTYIGRTDCAIECQIPPHLIKSAAKKMDGQLSCREISEQTGIALDQLTQLISQLDSLDLIDTQATKISVQRFHSTNPLRSTHKSDNSNDGAYKQLQSRITPELTFTTWHTNVKDAGVGLVGLRRNCEVEIFGRSRIVTLLYGILLSSGLSQTFLTSTFGPATISQEDLCAGFFCASDVGLSLKARSEELSRELSLFPLPANGEGKGGETLRKVIICVGPPPAELLQEWMSSGTPHLLIENPDCASMQIGPLILPGKTPCWRCISLARQDQDLAWVEIERQRISMGNGQVPTAIADHVAGFIALEILRFIDIGKSKLIGNSARISYHTPADLELTPYTRHPACGCNW